MPSLLARDNSHSTEFPSTQTSAWADTISRRRRTDEAPEAKPREIRITNLLSPPAAADVLVRYPLLPLLAGADLLLGQSFTDGLPLIALGPQKPVVS